MMTTQYMHRLNFIGTLLLSVAGLVAFTTPIAFGQLNARQSQAESKTQNTVAAVFAYDVVSIKPDKSGPGMPSVVSTDDGFTVKNGPVRGLIMAAFGVGSEQISGAPDWLASDRYDIQAKADGTVAEALKKLSPDDRKLARQRMVVGLLEDRCKFKFHRETKDLSAYTLVIAKNGPKFQESKPGETSSSGFKFPDGRGGTGSMRLVERGAVTFQGLPITFLVQLLSQQLGRPVLDKTGLTGKYDISLKWTPESGQFPGRPEGTPNGLPAPPPPAPDVPSLFTAVQEQLGLKLVSGKGPVEMIVIDQVERPSEN